MHRSCDRFDEPSADIALNRLKSINFPSATIQSRFLTCRENFVVRVIRENADEDGSGLYRREGNFAHSKRGKQSKNYPPQFPFDTHEREIEKYLPLISSNETFLINASRCIANAEFGLTY